MPTSADLAKALNQHVVQLYSGGAQSLTPQDNPMSPLVPQGAQGQMVANMMQFAPYLKGLMGQQGGTGANPWGAGGTMDAGSAPMYGMA